ncbi:hypothetical protein GCM10027020_17110 [Nocardioides salsibiostraticola]
MDPITDGAELWRLTAEHSPIGMALVGLDGQWLFCNRALSHMLGYEPAELTQLEMRTITHPGDLSENLERVASLLAGEIDSFRIRKRYIHASGEIVYGDLSVALARDAAGDPLYLVSQVLDVTEQQDNETRLAAAAADTELERRTLEAIFETVGVGLLLINRDGRYERMNRLHAEFMRLAFPDGHDGLAGKTGEVYHLDGETLMIREEMPSYRATRGEEFDDFTYWVGADPLTQAAFSVTARQMRDPSGNRTGAVLAYQEITELMRAIQVRNQFVASVSHELRTPLTSVLGHLEMLGDRDDLSAEVLGQLDVAQRNANRLRALVSDLLQVAQAQEGNLELQRRPADVAALVREEVEALRPTAERKQVVTDASGPDDLIIEIDEQRIRQVIDNLVTNAVKYTEPGGAVHVSLRPTGGGVEIAVTDTGIGIPADELDRVFSRFFRGSGAVVGQIPGTGLGLNIVASIVRAHGGTIGLQSEVGRGSTFLVTLPAKGS